MLRLRGEIGENQAVPVGRAAYAGAVVLEILLIVDGSAAADLVHRHFVVERHGSESVGQFGHLRGNLERIGAVVAHLRPALLALLGGDEHDAVGGAQTVDGRSGILQHRNVVDVAGVHTLEVLDRAGNTVDDHQRAAQTADVEVGVVGSRLGTLLPDAHTGHAAREHVLGVLTLGVDHLRTPDGSHGSRDRTAFLDAVTHDHNVVDQRFVAAEHDVDRRTAVDLLFPGREAHERECKRRIGRNVDHIAAFAVGHRTDIRIFGDDGGADDRFIVAVGHDSGHRCVLRPRRGGCKNKEETHQQAEEAPPRM